MVTDKLGHSHLGITLHWIDSSYEQFNFPLCLRKVTGRHTGALLASEMCFYNAIKIINIQKFFNGDKPFP
jgi:hypothetical protein